MKPRIGVDAKSGLVHTVIGTAAHVADVTQAQGLLHGDETDVFVDACYQGAAEREESLGAPVNWHVVMRPGSARHRSSSRSSRSRPASVPRSSTRSTS